MSAAPVMPAGPDDSLVPLLRRVALRYLPLLFLCYVVSIIDRVNVGFAKAQMQQTLQFSDVVYGLGAGIFFVGYFLFEVPSNMLLARIGARRWIARILILWGPAAAAMAFVETTTQFYVLRFLLGVFEAGFFPGVVLLLTYWFPAERRTRYIALFMLGMPVAGIVISPMSAAILAGMEGLYGLSGWQWIFVVQGLPALLLGFVVLVWLDDKPATARWLTDDEKARLQRAVGPAAMPAPWRQELKLAFAQKGIWLPVATDFCLVAVAAIVGLWAPQFMQDILQTDVRGITLPFGASFLVGMVAMVAIGALADRGGRRENILVALFVIGSVGYFGAAAAATAAPALAIGMMGIGIVCYLAAFPVFWGCVTPRLAPAAAAAAIALVNSLANLGGAVGPAVVGPVKQNLGLGPAVATMGVFMALAALFALALRRSPAAPSVPSVPSPTAVA